MADLLIKDGLVLTFEKDTLSGQIIPGGAVAVKGDSIVEIGESRDLSLKYTDAKTIDASGKIVMPGFIITHTHMPYVLGHSQPVDFSQLKSFWDMLQKMGWEWLEDITSGDGIYAATRYAAMKMLKNGTTTVCVMVEGPNALPGALSNSARAIEEVGIRAQDINGEYFEQEADGLLARVWQHETDHCNGVIIIDRMSRLQRITCRKTIKELEEAHGLPEQD